MSVIGHPSTAVRPGRADRTAPAGLAAALIGLGSLGILGSAVQLAAPGPPGRGPRVIVPTTSGPAARGIYG